MKLHLPSGLRRALLACLAAVALPVVSLPSTLFSASGIAAVALMANQRASSEEPSWTEGTATKDGTTDVSQNTNYTISETGNYTFRKGDGAGEVSIKLSSKLGKSNPIDVSLEGEFAEVWITCEDEARIRMTSGQKFAPGIGKLFVGGGAQLWFNGVTFSLNTELHLGSTSFSVPSDWGHPELDKAALALENTELTTTGSLVLEGDAKIGFVDTTSRLMVGGLTGGNDAAVRTLTLAGNNATMTLFKEGGANVRGQMKIGGSLTMGGEVTLVKSSKLEITGTLTTNNLTKLTLSTNSELTAGVSGTLAITELSIDGEATLKLADAAHLSFSTLSGGGTLTLDLSDITGNLDGYQLFEENIASWYSEWKDRIHIIGTSVSFTLTEDGTLAIGGLKWTGSGDAVTLGDTVSGEGWPGGDSSVGADTDVVLKGTSGSEVNVTVNGGDDSKVEMSSLTIGGGESSTTYAFTAAVSEQTLSVVDRLAVYADTSFNQNVNLTTGGNATITVGEGVTMSVQGDITFGTNAAIQLRDGAKLKYAVAGDSSALENLAQHLKSVTSGSATLELTGSGDLKIDLAAGENFILEKGIDFVYLGGDLSIDVANNTGDTGRFKIDGRLNVKGLALDGHYDSQTFFVFTSGGRVDGDLHMTNSACIEIGDDLIVTGDFFQEDEWKSFAHIKKHGDKDVFVLRERSGGETWDKFYGSYELYTIESGVGIGKAGEGKLTLSGGGELTYNFKAGEGEVEFTEAMTANGKALAVGEGATLTFTGGLTGNVSSLTLGDGARMELGAGSNELSLGRVTMGSNSVLDLTEVETFTFNGTNNGTLQAGEGAQIQLRGGNELLFTNLGLASGVADVLRKVGGDGAATVTLKRGGRNNVSQHVTFAEGIDVVLDTEYQSGSSYSVNLLGEDAGLTVKGNLTVKTADDATAGLYVNNGATLEVWGRLDASRIYAQGGGSEITLHQASYIWRLSTNNTTTVTLYDDLTVTQMALGTGTPFRRGEGVGKKVYLLHDVGGPVNGEFQSNFGAQLGEGVGIGKAGKGTLLDQGGDLINADFKIAEGAVQFLLGTFDIRGTITGDGNVIVSTGGGYALILNQGGEMTGEMQMGEGGANVQLGGDMTVGGLAANGGRTISTRAIRLVSEEAGPLTFTVNTAEGREYTLDGLDIGEGIKFVKEGLGSQTIDKFTIQGEAEVKGGQLIVCNQQPESNHYGVNRTDIYGKLTVSGGQFWVKKAPEGSRVEGALDSFFTGTSLFVRGGLDLVKGELVLGDGDTGTKIAMVAGDWNLNSGLTLHGDNILTLLDQREGNYIYNGQVIIMGDNFSITDEGSGTLTLQMNYATLQDVESGSIHLIQGDLWTENYAEWWGKRISVELIDPSSDVQHIYDGLRINKEGYLVWGDITDLYWGGGEDNRELIIGSSSSEWSYQSGKSGGEAWSGGLGVQLESNADAVSVTLAEDAEMANLVVTNATGVSTASRTTYTVRPSDTPKTLTVKGNLRLDPYKALIFENGAALQVTGGITLGEWSELRLDQSEDFDLEMTGKLDMGSRSKLTITGGGKLHLKNDTWRNPQTHQIASGAILTGDVELGGFGILELRGTIVGDVTQLGAQIRPLTGITIDGGKLDGSLTVSNELFTMGRYRLINGTITGDVTFRRGGTIIFEGESTIGGTLKLQGTDQRGHTVVDGLGTAGVKVHIGKLSFDQGFNDTIIKSEEATLDIGTLEVCEDRTLTFGYREDSNVGVITVNELQGEGTLVLRHRAVLELKEGGTIGALSLQLGSVLNLGEAGGSKKPVELTLTQLTAETDASLRLHANSTLRTTNDVALHALYMNAPEEGTLFSTDPTIKTTLEIQGGKSLSFLGTNAVLYWGKGCVVRFTENGSFIDLTNVVGSRDATDWSSENAPLTIDLTEEFMEGVSGRGIYRILTAKDWTSQWANFFLITLDGKSLIEGKYAGLRVDQNGYLTWDGSSTDLYWDGSTDVSKTLTWGVGETGGNEWGDEDDESAHNTPWEDLANATWNAQEQASYTVSLQGDVIANNLTVEGGADYTIKADGDAEKTLTVEGELTTTEKNDLTLQAQVTLSVYEADVKGKFTMEGGSKLVVEGPSVFSGEVGFTGDVAMDFSEMGVLSVKSEMKGEGHALTLTAGDGRTTRGFEFTGGGTLGQLAAGSVAGRLTGEWTISASSELGRLEMDKGDQLTLNLSGDFTVHGLSYGTDFWASNEGAPQMIVTNSGTGAIDFVINATMGANKVGTEGANFFYGGLTLGDQEHRVNLVKDGDQIVELGGQNKVEIFGDVSIKAGRLTFVKTPNGSVIHGTVTADKGGVLSLDSNNCILTIEGDGNGFAGRVDTLRWTGFPGDYSVTNPEWDNPHLYLGGDLEFSTLQNAADRGSNWGNDFGLYLYRWAGASSDNVYLLLTCDEDISETSDDYRKRFDKGSYARVNFNTGTGYGKTGAGKLTLTPGSDGKVKLGLRTDSEGVEYRWSFKVAQGELELTANAEFGKDLEVAGDATITFKGKDNTVRGNLIAKGGNVSIPDGATLRLGGWGGGSLSSLALGGGATLETAATTGAFNFGELTLGGASATINLTGILQGLTLEAKREMPLSGLKIKLSELFLDSLIGTDGYQLFEGESRGSLWTADNIENYEGNYKISLNDGKITVEDELTDAMTWSDDAEKLTWGGNAGESKWGDGHDQPYVLDGEGLGKDAIFAGTQTEETITVTLGGDLTMENMRVKHGKVSESSITVPQSYTFNLSGHGLTVSNSLRVDQGITVSISGQAGTITSVNNTFVNGTLKMETSGSKSLGKVLVGSSGELWIMDEHSWNDTTVYGPGTLVLATGGELTDQTWLKSMINPDNKISSLKLKNGTTLKISGPENGWREFLNSFDQIYVEAGAVMDMPCSVFVDVNGTSLLLGSPEGEGNGVVKLTPQESGFTQRTFTCAITLLGDAEICVQHTSQPAYVGGELDGRGHKLTLSSLEGTSGSVGVQLLSVSKSAGTFVIKGPVQLYSEQLTDWTFEMAGGQLNIGIGETGANPNQSRTVQGIDGSSGTITSLRQARLIIDASGTHSTSAEVRGGTGSTPLSITKKGTGKQTFAGVFAAQNVTVEAGTLEITKAGSAASLTVENGTLSLGGKTTFTAGELSGKGGTIGGLDGTLQLNAGADAEWGGQMVANFVYNGTGTFTLSAKQNDAGTVTARSGVLQLAEGGKLYGVTLDGGEMRIDGDATIGSFSAKAGVLKFSGQKLTLNVVAAADSPGSLEIDCLRGGKISFGSGADLSNQFTEGVVLNLTLTGLTKGMMSEENGNRYYDLFEGIATWKSDWAKYFNVRGTTTDTREFLVLDKATGRITLGDQPEIPSGAQAWKRGEGSLTWKKDNPDVSDDNVWTVGETENRAFTPGKDTVFAGTANTGPASSIGVTATGLLETGNLTVMRGKDESGTLKGGKYIFTLTKDDTSDDAQQGVFVDGTLWIVDGCEAEFQVGAGLWLKAANTLVGGNGAKLTLSGSGGYESLGDVTIDEGGEVVIKQLGTISGTVSQEDESTPVTTTFHGDGTLTVDFSDLPSGRSENFTSAFNSVIDPSKRLHALKLSHSTLWLYNEGVHRDETKFGTIDEVTVGDEAVLLLDVDAYTNKNVLEKSDLTLHLKGNGSTNPQGQGFGLYYDAAFSLFTANFDNEQIEAACSAAIGWKIKLDDDASIRVGRNAGEGNLENVLQMKGELTTGGHTLTKKGIGVLELTEDFRTNDAGRIEVAGGSLKLSYKDDQLEHYDIRLSGGTLEGEEGVKAYTFGSMSGGGGALKKGEGVTMTFTLVGHAAGDRNANLGTEAELNIGADWVDDWAGSNWVMNWAGGTQTVNGSVSLGDVTSRAGTLTLGEDVVNVQNVSLKGDGKLKLQTKAGAINGSVTTSANTTMIVDKGANVTVTGAMNAGGTVEMAGGNLTLRNASRIGTLSLGADGSTLSLTGAAETTVTKVDGGVLGESGEWKRLQALRIADGLKLTLGGQFGTLRMNELILGHGASIALEEWDTAAVHLLDIGAAGITDGNGNKATLTLSSDGIGIDKVEGTDYSLFTPGDWYQGWWGTAKEEGWLVIDGLPDYIDWKLTAEGQLHFYYLGVVWTGEGNQTWEASNVGKSDADWDESTAPKAGENVVFYDVEDPTKMDVKVKGTIDAGEVYVASGAYTFTADGDGLIRSDKGMTVAKKATVVWDVPFVGTASGGQKSVIDLQGILQFGEAAQLTGNVSLQFNGGTLEVSKSGMSDIVNGIVDADGSKDRVRVDVAPGIEYAWTDNSKEVSPGGVRLALQKKGLVKTGSGTFTLNWAAAMEADPNATPEVEVEEGTLKLKHTGTGKATLGGHYDVAEDSSTLVLEGQDLDFAAELTGKGQVTVGSESETAKVTLSGDGTGFSGQVTLMGSGKKDGSCVTLTGANALSLGEGATLRLQGVNLIGALAPEVGGGEEENTPEPSEAGVVIGGEGVNITVRGQTRVGGVTLRADLLVSDPDADWDSDSLIATSDSILDTKLSGGSTNYAGSFDTENGAAWTFMVDKLDESLGYKLQGNGRYVFSGMMNQELKEKRITLNGGIEGSAGVTNEVKDLTLLIVGPNSSTGALTASEGAMIQLGEEAGDGTTWNGSRMAGPGTIVLRNVVFGRKGGITSGSGDAKIIVDAGENCTVDMNGMDVRRHTFNEVTLASGAHLDHLRGKMTADEGHTQFHLAVDSLNTEYGSEVAEGYMISAADGEELTLTVKEKDSFVLDFTPAALVDTVKNALKDRTAEARIHVLKGGTLDITDDILLLLLGTKEGDQAADLLSHLGFVATRTEGGDLILQNVATRLNVYFVTNDKDMPNPDLSVVDGYGILSNRDATFVDEDAALTLNLHGAPEDEKDAWVNNLVGLDGSSFTANNDGEERAKVVFSNQVVVDSFVDGRPNDDEKKKLRGQNTEFEGNIRLGGGVDADKVGAGTLTVGGNYTLSDGSTTIKQGAIRLRGSRNSMEGLVFEYSDSAAEGEERGLLLEGGKTTITGEITDSANQGDGNDIVLSKGAELTLEGASTLNDTGIIGDEAHGGDKLSLTGEEAALELKGEGKPAAVRDDDGNITNAQLSGVDVKLGKGGSLTLGQNAGMDVGAVDVGANSTLDIGSGQANHVDSLTGTGTLKSDGTGDDGDGGVLHVGGGWFSGTLAGSGETGTGKAGKLVVDDGKSFTFDNASSLTPKENAWGVDIGQGSQLTVAVGGTDEPDGDVPSGPFTLGDVNIGEEGNFCVDFGEAQIDGNLLNANVKSVQKDGVIEFHSDSSLKEGDFHTGITLDETLRDDINDYVKFTGLGGFVNDNSVYVDSTTGEIMVGTRKAQDNKFERVLPDMAKNARAGATMVWDALTGKDGFQALLESWMDPSSDLASATANLIGMVENGKTSELEKALAAVAGSSVSVLGPALVQDLHRQLGAIRNRTTTMANEVTYASYDKLPAWHAWLNAEGNYHKMDSDGFAPGYTLNNWGGTVGADVDVSPATTVGFALTAMYGDLKPESADAATGDLDTTYLSAFARTTKGAWLHTFVVSVGMADVSLNRTVNAGGASYRTQGSTDGYAMGVLYEVGYTKLMNRKGTMAFQPVFNVEIRHAAIKGYTETGSDAGLKVDDIEQDVVTFGFGARLQSIVGENIYNRTSVLEGRLLVKADVGDNTGVAKNSLIGAPTVGEVESAEVGALGIEAGIGLTIPLGASAGSVFMDASAEVRSGWTSFNATVGYRINF